MGIAAGTGRRATSPFQGSGLAWDRQPGAARACLRQSRLPLATLRVPFGAVNDGSALGLVGVWEGSKSQRK